MSDREIDWSRIRGVPWEDDPPDRAELVSEVERLRRLLEDRRTDASGQSPAALAELRRLAEKVEVMAARLPPLLATTEDAAQILGVSTSTVRRQVRAGTLPSRRIGHCLRIDLSRVRGLDSDDVAALAREARNGRG